MAWLPTATYSAPGVPLYGQGGSPNLDLSTLTLEAGGTSTILECFPSTGRLQTITGSSVIEISLSGVLGGVSIVDANGTETLFANDRVVASSISTLAIAGNVGFFDTLSTTVFEADQIYNSTISTAQIDIDGQTLNATATELLLNGLPIATLSNLSSIADWALDPAISTVQMNGNDLIDARNLFGQNLGVSSIYCSSIYALNAFHTSTYTSTISSVLEVADACFFSSVSSGFITADQISTNSLFVSSINGSEITTSSITISSMVTQAISSVFLQASSISGTFVSTLGAEIRQGLMSSIVFSPSLNPSLGGVNVNLGLGGILGNVIGWGAGVFGAATGIVALGTSMAALAMGRQTTYIDNTKYELVNGTTQIQFSTLGDSFSTIYRFNNSADPERVPGEEVFISTIYPPGLAVRSMSDPIYTLSTPQSSIQSFGQWVPLPPETLASTFSTLYAGNLFANRITTSSIVGGEASLLTIGAPLIYLSTAAGVGGLVYTDGEMDALRFESRDVWTSSILTSSINASTVLASFIQPDGSDLTIRQGTGTEILLTPGAIRVDALDAAVTSGDNAVGLFVDGIASTVTLSAASSIRMFPGLAVPSWVEINGDVNVIGRLNASSGSFVSTLSTATIFGANPNLFAPALLGNPGLKLDAPEIFLSTGQTNITGFTNASTVGANRVYSRLGEFSTLNVTGLSTITLSTLGTTGTQGQPAGRLGLFGNDLDAGNQDIWCNQIRVGAGQSSAPGTAEVTFYDVTGTRVKGLLTGSSDTTIRISDSSVPGVNSPGYLLDTRINPPFFSTINQSTSLMAYFPSTSANTIGVSTISFIPPKIVAGTFISLSTQNIVANTPLILWNEVTDFTTGGLTTSTNALVVPSPGIYELTTSIQFTKTGGAGTADWWFRVNGVDLVNSASEIYLPAGGSGQALGNITLSQRFNTGDKIQIVVASPDTGVAATFLQSTVTTPYTRPAVPSVITGVKCLNY